MNEIYIKCIISFAVGILILQMISSVCMCDNKDIVEGFDLTSLVRNEPASFPPWLGKKIQSAPAPAPVSMKPEAVAKTAEKAANLLKSGGKRAAKLALESSDINGKCFNVKGQKVVVGLSSMGQCLSVKDGNIWLPTKQYPDGICLDVSDEVAKEDAGEFKHEYECGGDNNLWYPWYNPKESTLNQDYMEAESIMTSLFGGRDFGKNAIDYIGTIAHITGETNIKHNIENL